MGAPEAPKAPKAPELPQISQFSQYPEITRTTPILDLLSFPINLVEGVVIDIIETKPIRTFVNDILEKKIARKILREAVDPILPKSMPKKHDK